MLTTIGKDAASHEMLKNSREICSGISNNRNLMILRLLQILNPPGKPREINPTRPKLRPKSEFTPP